MSLDDETEKTVVEEPQVITVEQKTEPSVVESAQLIYCGPNLPRAILNQYTVYQNGLPKHLESHLEKCPALRRMFVPIEDFSKTTTAIDQKGTAEHVWFHQIVEYFTGGANA